MRKAIVTLVLRFLFAGLLFLLFAFNLITKPPHSRTSHGTDMKKCFSEPSYDWNVSHIHLVFIGDSLTRYQFLATAYQLYFRTPAPKYIVNEKVHKSWLNFYQNTSVIFDGSMKCDCFRYENDVYKQSVKQSFSFSRENRFFSFSLRCENSATLKVLFTYIQFFGDKKSLHGRVLPWNIKHASPTKTMRKSLWRYYELREALESFVAKLKTKPTHIILNAGIWPHAGVMGTLKTALIAANRITPKVYWKETSPDKTCLTQKEEARRNGIFNCPRDIDKLAQDYCGSMKLCKYIEFPKNIPLHMLNEEYLPEYIDNIHFSSSELYLFWSRMLFSHMDLNSLSEAIECEQI